MKSTEVFVEKEENSKIFQEVSEEGNQLQVNFTPNVRQSKFIVEDTQSLCDVDLFVWAPFLGKEVTKPLQHQKFEPKNSFKISKNNELLKTIFQRKEYASSTLHKKLFIHGGKTPNGKNLRDLIRVDFEKNRIDVFKKLHKRITFSENGQAVEFDDNLLGLIDLDTVNEDLMIPGTYNHKMIPIFNGLMILYSFHEVSKEEKKSMFKSLKTHISKNFNEKSEYLNFAFISHPEDDTIHCGYPLKITNDTRMVLSTKGNFITSTTRFKHPFHATEHIPALSDFVCGTIWPSGVFVYGDGDVYILSTTHPSNPKSENFDGGVKFYHKSILYSEESKKYDWPIPRKGCGFANCSDKMYIFSGMEYSIKKSEKLGISNGRFLNDLWVFDTLTEMWKQIETSPLPYLFNPVTWKNNTGFCFLGGMKKKLFFHHYDSLSENFNVFNSIYGYDENEGKFYIMETMSDIPCCTFGRHSISSDSSYNKVMIFGGVSVNEIQVSYNTNFLKNSTSIVVIDNAFDSGEPFELLKYLVAQRKSQTFTDIIIQFQSCDSEILSFQTEAHLAILNARCPTFVNFLLASVKNEKGKYKTTVKVISSDFNGEDIENFINFLYSGDIILKGEHSVRAFLLLCEKFSKDRFFPLAKNICFYNFSNLDDGSAIFNQIQSDFGNLFLEMDDKKGNKFSDVVLSFKDGFEMNLHKVFLCRLPHFQTMLQKGFKESCESRINFKDFDMNAMKNILKYVYTEKIQMDETSVVNTLLFSLQFNLPKVSNHCRKFLSLSLSVNNVVQLLSMADFYADLTTANICVRFIVENYQNVKIKESDNIEKERITQINELVAKKNKLKKKN